MIKDTLAYLTRFYLSLSSSYLLHGCLHLQEFYFFPKINPTFKDINLYLYTTPIFFHVFVRTVILHNVIDIIPKRWFERRCSGEIAQQQTKSNKTQIIQ